MNIITTDIGGVIQSWDEKYPVPDNCAIWPDELDTTNYYAYNGFVILNVEEIDGVKTVVSYIPDVEAWEEWKKNNPDVPEIESSPQDDIDAMMVDHEYRLTLLELGLTE